jgi:hypothetical protein
MVAFLKKKLSLFEIKGGIFFTVLGLVILYAVGSNIWQLFIGKITLSRWQAFLTAFLFIGGSASLIGGTDRLTGWLDIFEKPQKPGSLQIYF